MMACANSDAAVVARLLNEAANTDLLDENGETALILASQNGHAEVVSRLLEEGASVDIQSKTGATALMAASANNHSDTVNVLLSAGYASYDQLCIPDSLAFPTVPAMGSEVSNTIQQNRRYQ